MCARLSGFSWHIPPPPPPPPPTHTHTHTHTRKLSIGRQFGNTFHTPYPEPVVFQWQSSVPGTKTPVYTGMPLEECQCASNGLPVAFQWSSSVFQLCKLTLDRHWVLASASVVPVASQCTCGSSGLPVCSNYANQHWIATGTPLGASISQRGSSGIPVYLWLQWSSSVACPVVSQCTDRIWFGGH